MLTMLLSSSLTNYQLVNSARELNVNIIEETDFGRKKRVVMCEVLRHIIREDNSSYYKELLKEHEQVLNLMRPLGFQCCFTGCHYECQRHFQYIIHLQNSHFLDKNLLCNFSNYRKQNTIKCQQRFNSIEALVAHVSEVHQLKENCDSNEGNASAVHSEQRISNIGIICRCNMESCGKKTFPNLKLLMKHINSLQHLNETRTCIFDGCSTTFKPSMPGRNHFNLQHTKKNLLKLKAEHIVLNSNIVADNTIEHVANPGLEHPQEESNDDDENIGTEEIPLDENIENIDIDCERENFLKLFADFLNRLANVKMIAQSSVDTIVEGFLKISLKSKHLQKLKLQELFRRTTPSDDIQSEIFKIIDDDDMINAQRLLSSRKKRDKFMKDNFQMVEAQEIVLNPDEVLNEGKPKDAFYYVPLLDSAKVLFEDHSFLHVLEKSQSEPRDPSDGDLLEEICDGSFIKSLPYFQRHPEAYIGLLYSDEVEVVSPLGAGRGRHKVLQLFWTIGNIQKQFRSQVDTIQLGIVVKSSLIKKYGYRKIYKQLISDMKILEDEGIIVKHPYERRIRVCFPIHIGDNLEAANLGKF